MFLTSWLIHRRDAAATAWLQAREPHRRDVRTFRRARRRLAFWDAFLDAWTRRGTRRV